MQIMKAKIGEKSFLEKTGYIYEPKLDGFRALCYINENIKLISRNEKSFNEVFPTLTKFRKNINAQSCILDGEIIAYDDYGNPNFSMLDSGKNLSYVVFDILELNSELLIKKPLIERKKILDQVVKTGNNIEVMFYTPDGQKLWEEMLKRNLEGVIAKKINGLYYPGKRTDEWVKIKFFNTIDCVIVGYISGRRNISSLALALYGEDKKLHYIGNVGTGFNQSDLSELEKILKPIKVENLSIVLNPERGAVWLRSVKKINWVKPKFVCEVKYQELTSYGILRIAVFQRLREDKKPKECTIKDQLKMPL